MDMGYRGGILVGLVECVAVEFVMGFYVLGFYRRDVRLGLLGKVLCRHD